MNILYYDQSAPKDKLFEAVKILREILASELIVLPKNYELILDCPLSRLLEIRGLLDKAIKELEEKNC